MARTTTRTFGRTGAIGTRNILELTKRAGARLAFASSSEIYGEVEADWLYEDLDKAALYQPNEYALSKWTSERQVVNFQQRYGLDAVRLRFFNAYGPGEEFHPYRSVVSLFCHKALRGEMLPVYKDYHRTFMYIDDFIPTLANVCSAGLKYDVYNIGGEDYRSVEELAQLIQRQVDDHPVAVDLIDEDLHNVRNKRPDITRAREDLGHQPEVKIEEGVPKTLEWMRARLTEGVAA
jgi:dTDP-glucose 4,6-dehydratase